MQRKAAGTGWKSKKRHAQLTSDGIKKRLRKGLSWGPRKKATPEVVARAKEMLRNGVSLTEVCKVLNVSTPTLYQAGIRQRELKKEGQQGKELPLEVDNVVRLKG